MIQLNFLILSVFGIITKWQQDRMSNGIDVAEGRNVMTAFHSGFDYHCGLPITNAQKLVMFFKFVAAVGKTKIRPRHLKEMIADLGIAYAGGKLMLHAHGLEYFDELLT